MSSNDWAIWTRSFLLSAFIIWLLFTWVSFDPLILFQEDRKIERFVYLVMVGVWTFCLAGSKIFYKDDWL